MQISIPVPRPGVPGDRKRYPFDRLSIGDSMFVPTQRASMVTLREVVRYRQERNPGEAYRVQEATNGGTIITRVA